MLQLINSIGAAGTQTLLPASPGTSNAPGPSSDGFDRMLDDASSAQRADDSRPPAGAMKRMDAKPSDASSPSAPKPVTADRANPLDASSDAHEAAASTNRPRAANEDDASGDHHQRDTDHDGDGQAAALAAMIAASMARVDPHTRTTGGAPLATGDGGSEQTPQHGSIANLAANAINGIGGRNQKAQGTPGGAAGASAADPNQSTDAAVDAAAAAIADATAAYAASNDGTAATGQDGKHAALGKAQTIADAIANAFKARSSSGVSRDSAADLTAATSGTDRTALTKAVEAGAASSDVKAAESTSAAAARANATAQALAGVAGIASGASGGSGAVSSGVTSALLGPQDASSVVSQLVEAIRLQATEGGGEAHVALEPNHLGPVTLTIRVDGDSVSAHAVVESPTVREWLRSNEGLLRQGLVEQGLKLDRLDVAAPTTDVPRRDTNNTRDQSSQSQDRRQSRPRRRADSDATFELIA